MKEIAIIGQTASGKSALALELAQITNSYILSIDSLSIYKEIDIASAKPSRDELEKIEHFGIDILDISQDASVYDFIDEYKKIKNEATKNCKNIIIVGGSSFYLKSMIDGLSAIPKYGDDITIRCSVMMQKLDSTYKMLYDLDIDYMSKIAQNDRYRIEKALLIYLSSGMVPSQWFKMNPKTPIIENIEIYNIEIDREILRKNIELRTLKMIENGLIDEIAFLEHKYGRKPNAMKAIGVIETLEFLDGKISKSELYNQIVTHTAQLAKRQNTFNIHQFENIVSKSSKEIYNMISGATGEI